MSEGLGRETGMIARVMSDLSLDHSQHVPSLFAAARKALAEGDASASWLAADRLCRITGGEEALPLLLRAAALAQLGDANAATLDLEQAWQVNPELPVVCEGHLAHPLKERRLASARVLIRSTGGFFAPAMRALARENVGAVCYVTTQEDTLVVRVRTATAGPFLLTAFDGLATHKVAMVAHPMADHGPFPCEAEITMPWPGDGVALAFTLEGSQGVIEPATVHRFSRPLPIAPPRQARSVPMREGIMVIVPVYDDAEATAQCLRSVCAGLPHSVPSRIVVINDASPNPLIAPMLDQFAATGAITLLTNAVNLGFAGSVNRALDMRACGEDALLLNADTLMPRGAIERLHKAAHRDATTGTATPLSNNGEDTSMPKRFVTNPMPEMEQIERLDRLAAHINGGKSCEMPNGVGFCLFIRGDCLDEAGGLSTEFARGYYEDVEFCLRVRASGRRNVCALDTFVGHAGSLSFKHAKKALVRRNFGRLVERFPDYPRESAMFQASDPLKPFIQDIERAALAEMGAVRLILAPDSLPDAVAMRVAVSLAEDTPFSAPPPQSAALIVRLSQAEPQLQMQSPSEPVDLVTIKAVSGGLPQNLSLSASQWFALVETLARNRAIVDVVCVDPALLAPCMVQSALEQAGQVKVVATDTILTTAPLPPWLSPWISPRLSARPVVMTETAAMRDAFVRGSAMQSARMLPQTHAVPSPPRHRGRGPLAIIAETLDSRSRDFMGTLAQCLADSPNPHACVLLGRDGDDLALMRSHQVWVSGQIQIEEWPTWMTHADVSALLFVSRHHGLTHPVMERWAAHMPVACFDTYNNRSTPWLGLSPDAPDMENAVILSHWLAGYTLG